MPVTVIVGGQYGSEGKGKMTSYLALKDNAAAVIRCGGPNAGHTVDFRGERHVLRQLPCGVTNPNSQLLIAAGAIVDPSLLLQEIECFGVADRVQIDENASVLEESDKRQEQGLRLRTRLASTLSGTGVATSRKVLRDERLKLASQHPVLKRWTCNVSQTANRIHDEGGLILVEGTQGFGLSLHHGGPYPFRTSRDTSAANFLSEAGLSPRTVSDIVLVIRTFPIRVGGDSGPFDAPELTWEAVQGRSGYPHQIEEYTSATGRLRRVAEFDTSIVRRAVEVNRPTHLAIHGLDYIDYRDFGCLDWAELSVRSREFVGRVERACFAPASFLFTGPPNECLIDRRCEACAIN